MANRYIGIQLRDSTHGILENNTISETVWTGISVSNSSNLSIRNNRIDDNGHTGIMIGRESNDIQVINNSITGNVIGIQSYSDSIGIIAHYNMICNNSEYGIGLSEYGYENAVPNFDARYNYWGDPTGPYNNESNPEGTGDNITRYVRFEPWLDEHGDLRFLPDEPDDPDWIPLFLLMVILAGLFGALIHVVRTPTIGTSDTIIVTTDIGGAPGNAQEVRKTEGTEVTCQYCLERFFMKETDKAIRVTCPLCGKETLRDHLINLPII